MKLLLVFVGGGLGAAIRWLVGQNMAGTSEFPWSTFTVNMVGCFLIGLVGLYLLNGNEKWYLLGVIGFLGGFTTFSSFGFDLLNLLQNGNARLFWIYLVSSNALGVLFVYVGYQIGNVYLK